MANKLFSDKIIFRKNLTPSPFGTDLCSRYVTSKGFRHVVALHKPFILRRMQHFYKVNTEAARNTQTLGGKPIFSSEILGRHNNIARAERVCRVCNMQQTESEYHFMLVCPAYRDLRVKFLPRYCMSWPSLL